VGTGTGPSRRATDVVAVDDGVAGGTVAASSGRDLREEPVAVVVAGVVVERGRVAGRVSSVGVDEDPHSVLWSATLFFSTSPFG